MYDFMNYDYDIRDVFEDTLGKETLSGLCENINDLEMLRLATEFLRFAAERLNADLDSLKINEEYVKLRFIIENLEKIIKEYV